MVVLDPPAAPTPLHLDAPGSLRAAVDEAATAWTRARGTERLWRRDATLWTGSGEDRWLGWLDVSSRQLARVERFTFLRRTVQDEGFGEVVVLGMGGSSLFPEVVRGVLAPEGVAPRGRVLDTTDPTVLAQAAAALDPARTLFVVSSKSGTTLETRLLADWARALVPDPIPPASRMAFITDPGSPLWHETVEAGAWSVFAGEPEIGGRFSAMSDFGLVPAALMGADVPRMLAHAAAMERASRGPDPARNPGVALGLALAAAYEDGRDKLTILAEPELAPFALWLEQLLSESTGKTGKGIAVVAGEPMGEAATYGDDRLFLVLGGDPLREALATRADALAKLGHPLLTCALSEPEALAGEVVRWEVAVAVAAARMEIDPFSQPDVEATKAATRELLAQGAPPPVQPDAVGGGLELFGTVPEGEARLTLAVAHLLGQLPVRGELSILAYLPPSEEVDQALARLRARVRDARGTAVTVGYGPRYLHSTGQLHKGGQGGRVHLVLTREPAHDPPLPGRAATPGQVQRAQARADAAVLRERGRAVLEIHIQQEARLGDGLARVDAALEAALRGGR